MRKLPSQRSSWTLKWHLILGLDWSCKSLFLMPSDPCGGPRAIGATLDFSVPCLQRQETRWTCMIRCFSWEGKHFYPGSSGRSSCWEAQSTDGMQISMEEKEEMKDPKSSTMCYWLETAVSERLRLNSWFSLSGSKLRVLPFQERPLIRLRWADPVFHKSMTGHYAKWVT